MILSNLGKYNLWAGNESRKILQKLALDKFDKIFEEPIGSLRKKVEHILLAYETCYSFYYSRWDDIEKRRERVKSMTKAELLEYWEVKDRFLAEQLEKRAVEKVRIQRTSQNDYFVMSGGDFLVQYILHTVYHRGQLNYCLKLLDSPRIEADYLYFFDELDAKE
ncbi:MAG: DinB family protein [Candidatus Heimdallarchaeota archaeon]